MAQEQNQKHPVNARMLTLLLAACSMIGPFASDMYMPSFTELTEVFGVPLEAVQQTLTSYLFGFAGMNLFYGTISDVAGRKTTLIGGFSLFALASLGATFSQTLEQLIIFRFCQGLCAGCGTVVGMAVIRDLYEGVQAQRMMAYVTMVFGFGPAIAPVLGGWFAVNLGWHSHFVALTVISTMLALLCLLFLPESLPKEKRLPVKLSVLMGGYGRILKHAGFVVGSTSLALCFLGQGIFIAGAADWCVNVMGLGVDEFWKLFLPAIGGNVLGSWMSGRLATKLGTVGTIRAGFAVMIGSAALAAFAIASGMMQTVALAVLPLFVYTVGMGIVRPGMSLILLDCFPKTRGMASSVQHFMQTLWFALGSAAIVPFLYGSANLYWGALIVLALMTIALWQMMTLIQRRQNPTD